MNAKRIVALSLVLAGVVMSGYSAVVTNWVGNPGFENPTSNTYPDAGTTPWVAQENNVWPVQREQGIVHGGTNSVVYQYYGNTDTVRQDLPVGISIDTNALYELRFWMRLDEMSTNPAHTNDTIVQAMISTTTNGVHGSTYKWKATKYNLAPSTAGVWEEIVVHFDPSGWTALQGEYIRLSIKKSLSASQYRPFIDDVQFGVYEPDAPPASVLIGYYGSNGGTNDYTAPGIEGAVFLDKAYQKNANAGSTDGTYGNTNGATIVLTGYDVRIGNNPVSNQTSAVGFKVTNKTGAPLQLDSINFDFAPYWETSPDGVVLTYEWGALNVPQGTVVNSTNGLVHLGASNGDYHDFDWSLAGLADTVLSAGETAAFRLTATNAVSIWNSSGFDNIAVLGGAYSGSGYDAWAGDYGVTGGELDDDDSDGWSNLYEYGVGGNPTNGFINGWMPHITNTASGLLFLHGQHATDTSLTYYLEMTDDLMMPSWTNIGYTVVSTNVTGYSHNWITNSIPTTDSQKFIRLMIGN